MSEHQSRHTGMGCHHSAFRESDAHLLHIEELVDEEICTRIRQRRIADGWPDALILLPMLLFDGKMFIGCIAPVGLSYLFVQFLGSSLCQSVAQGLCHHVEIIIVPVGIHDSSIYRRTEHPNLVFLPVSQRANEISQTEIRCARSRRMLLAEHRKTELLIQEQDIIPIAVGIEELEDGMAVKPVLPGGKHIQRFLLHLLLVAAWLPAQSPGMIEIEPVDIRHQF